MNTALTGRERTASTLGRHHFGVIVCLIALLLAVFAHVELPSAAAAQTQPAAISFVANVEHAMDGSGSVSANHCVQHAQCAFHALVPMASDDLPTVAVDVTFVAFESGRDRSVSPQPHPPKAS